MLVFLFFLQGFKGEPGEDGVMVSIAQKHLCVCPSPSLYITLHLTAARGFVLLVEDKKPLMEL